MIGDILQPTHLLFILVIALLVLGPKRLPEVGRSLGRGLRDFRAAMSGEDDEPLQPLPQQTTATAPTAPAQASPVPAPAAAPPTPPPAPQAPQQPSS